MGTAAFDAIQSALAEGIARGRRRQKPAFANPMLWNFPTSQKRLESDPARLQS